MAPKVEKLLTIEDLSEITGWSPGTISGKVSRRQIPFTRLGARTVRFRPADLAKLLTPVPAVVKTKKPVPK